MGNTQTLYESFLTMGSAIPYGLIICCAWYVACILLFRRHDAEWKASLASEPATSVSDDDYDGRIAVAELRLYSLQDRRFALCSGAPSTRVFMAGLFCASLCVILFVLYLMTGLGH